MRALFNHLEDIRKQCCVEELDVVSTAKGLKFYFIWKDPAGEIVTWPKGGHMYHWGEIDHAPPHLIYDDLIATANKQIKDHNNKVVVEMYNKTMKGLV